MGRGKLKMEMIEKEKSRSLTFHKRKQGLFKKMHELTTLCSIPACMIVYDPSNASTSVWPENSDDEVRRLVDAYKSNIKAAGGVGGGVKSYGLPDFFSDRRKEIEGELAKLRKNKYPTWDDRFSAMDEFQLRNLGAQLRIKAQNVRIQLMRERERERVKSEQQFYNNYLGLDFLANNAQIPVNVQSYYHDPPPPPPLPLQNVRIQLMRERERERVKSEQQFYNNYLGLDFLANNAQIPVNVQSYYHDLPPLQYYPAAGPSIDKPNMFIRTGPPQI